MQLYSLLIEGFRKHLKMKVIFSDSTFLIGENEGVILSLQENDSA